MKFEVDCSDIFRCCFVGLERGEEGRSEEMLYIRCTSFSKNRRRRCVKYSMSVNDCIIITRPLTPPSLSLFSENSRFNFCRKFNSTQLNSNLIFIISPPPLLSLLSLLSPSLSPSLSPPPFLLFSLFSSLSPLSSPFLLSLTHSPIHSHR